MDGGGFGTGGSYCRAVELGEFVHILHFGSRSCSQGYFTRGTFQSMHVPRKFDDSENSGLSRLESRISSFNLLTILFEKTPQHQCRLNTFNPCLSDARLRSTYGQSHFSHCGHLA
jgi:hypothetical protein